MIVLGMFWPAAKKYLLNTHIFAHVSAGFPPSVKVKVLTDLTAAGYTYLRVKKTRSVIKFHLPICTSSPFLVLVHRLNVISHWQHCDTILRMFFLAFERW